MSKMTKQNQGEAHAAAKGKAPTLEARVIAALKEHIYCTRRQLHEQTGIEIASLCGTLATLKKKLAIREPFSIECPTTGKMVVVYTLNTGEIDD